MAIVKQAVFLLLLLAVSAYADHHEGHADHTDHADHANHTDHAVREDHIDLADCLSLNRALHSKDRHKSFGDWVLVYSVAEQGEAFLRNLSSSRIEVRLLDDNKTVTYKEWNKFADGSCDSYFFKTSLPENRADDDHHVVPVSGFHYEKNGEVERNNETGEFQFFQTCNETMVTIYKGEGRKFLLSYRKEGLHRDVEQLRAHDDRHNRQAKCLGFSHEGSYRYDGVAEHCSKETPDAVREHLEHRGNHGGSGHNGHDH